MSDYVELSMNKVLSFAATGTSSTGTVTVTAVDNDVDDKSEFNPTGSRSLFINVVSSSTSVSVPGSVSFTVTDDSDAKPGEPATLMAAPGDGEVMLTWTAPTSPGTSTITGYKYGAGETSFYYVGLFASSSSDVPSPGLTITINMTTDFTPAVLVNGTGYTFGIAAVSDAGTGAFKVIAATPAANEDPTFTSAASFNVVENSTRVGTVEAEDSDGADNITAYAVTAQGVDGGLFSITSSNGELSFGAAPNFEDPRDVASISPVNGAKNNEYIVQVEATSGTGTREKKATQTITVTVINVNTEAPGRPNAPTVAPVPGNHHQLDVSWIAPMNTGPAITDYDVRYRIADSGATFDDAGHVGPGATTRISSLISGTNYEVGVLAKNAEGSSAFSQSGFGSTTVAGAQAGILDTDAITNK